MIPPRAGVLGLPGAGKSTVFRLVAGEGAGGAAAHGAVPVRTVRIVDHRLEWLARLQGSRKVVHSSLELLDLPWVGAAGAEASGEATERLARTREVEALLCVVRGFSNPSYPYRRSAPDPARDAAEVAGELLLADLAIVEGRLDRVRASRKKPRGDQEALALEEGLLERLRTELERGGALQSMPLHREEEKLLRGFRLLTLKPVVTVLNLGEGTAPSEEEVRRAALPGSEVLPLDARLEAELLAIPEGDRAELAEGMGVGRFRGPELVPMLLGAMRIRHFLTATETEARAWPMREGTTALEAAGAIHTDIAQHFVKAEVVAFDDLRALGSMKEARARGRVRLEGKDYEMREGDVVLFKHAG